MASRKLEMSELGASLFIEPQALDQVLESGNLALEQCSSICKPNRELKNGIGQGRDLDAVSVHKKLTTLTSMYLMYSVYLPKVSWTSHIWCIFIKSKTT